MQGLPTTKNRTTIHCRFLSWVFIFFKRKKRLKWKDTITPMFTTAVFTNAKIYEATQAFINRWKDKEDVMYIVIWKIHQWPQDWKRSVLITISKKGNAKEYSNYHTIALISHASKVCSKNQWTKLQQYSSIQEVPDVQAGFRKGRGTREQIADVCWIIEKAKELQKNIYICFIDYTKAIDSGS